jgi:hypothetical protein
MPSFDSIAQQAGRLTRTWQQLRRHEYLRIYRLWNCFPRQRSWFDRLEPSPPTKRSPFGRNGHLGAETVEICDIQRQDVAHEWTYIAAASLASYTGTPVHNGRILVFIDESGLRQQPHRCRTWAPRGLTRESLAAAVRSVMAVVAQTLDGIAAPPGGRLHLRAGRNLAFSLL